MPRACIGKHPLVEGSGPEPFPLLERLVSPEPRANGGDLSGSLGLDDFEDGVDTLFEIIVDDGVVEKSHGLEFLAGESQPMLDDIRSIGTAPA